MSFSSKTAKLAVTSFLLAIMASVGVASGATSDASDDSLSLLPQSVRDMALSEAQSPVDFRFIPETTPEDQTTEAKPPSLSATVEAKKAEIAADSEEKCLASAIFYESRSESFEGQLAVAQVILNRVESGRFARSICGVILQPGQFSFVRGGAIPPIRTRSKDWQEALAIARIAQAKLHRSGAGDALFFHATHVNPKWRLSRVTSIGNHVFYR